MSGYRPFQLTDFGLAGATVATAATLPGEEPQTVATVARGNEKTEALEAQSVANVASVAPAVGKTEVSADGPHGWRGRLLALSPDQDPCPGFRPGTWARVQANALDFIDRHGEEAERLGWTATELFGVHPVIGVVRVDHAGALMLTVGGGVESVEAEAIRYAGGLVYRRSPIPAAAVPVWDFRAGSTGQ